MAIRSLYITVLKTNDIKIHLAQDAVTFSDKKCHCVFQVTILERYRNFSILTVIYSVSFKTLFETKTPEEKCKYRSSYNIYTKAKHNEKQHH